MSPISILPNRQESHRTVPITAWSPKAKFVHTDTGRIRAGTIPPPCAHSLSPQATSCGSTAQEAWKQHSTPHVRPGHVYWCALVTRAGEGEIRFRVASSPCRFLSYDRLSPGRKTLHLRVASQFNGISHEKSLRRQRESQSCTVLGVRTQSDEAHGFYLSTA